MKTGQIVVLVAVVLMVQMLMGLAYLGVDRAFSNPMHFGYFHLTTTVATPLMAFIVGVYATIVLRPRR